MWFAGVILYFCFFVKDNTVMDKKKLIIIGGGDFAHEVACVALLLSWEVVGAVDDDWENVGQDLLGLGISTVSFDMLADIYSDDCFFVLGVGMADIRVRLLGRLLSIVPDARFASVIHPQAVIGVGVGVGVGCYVGPNCSVAVGAVLGRHVLVNQNCSVGHHVELGDCSVVSPGCLLSGRCRVGKASFLGSGVVVYPGKVIGCGCMVSANGVVGRDLPDGCKYLLKPEYFVL